MKDVVDSVDLQSIPRGVLPRHYWELKHLGEINAAMTSFWEQERIKELEAGIRDYTKVKQTVPVDWIIELADLLKKHPEIVRLELYEI